MVAFLLQWNWWYWQSAVDLFETWRYLGWLSRGIVLVLLVMLVQIFVITVAAAVRQASARQSRRFAMEVKAALDDGQLNDAIAVALKYKNSHAAAVTAAGLGAYRDLPQSLRDEEAIECVERAMERVSAVRAAEMRLGLRKLTTIAETAPLIGAFGMMLGLFSAFLSSGNGWWYFLMSFAGACFIALMFAALGLFVAILSMWAHGWLEQRSRTIALEMRNSALKNNGVFEGVSGVARFTNGRWIGGCA